MPDLDTNLNVLRGMTDEELAAAAGADRNAAAVLMSRYSKLISVKSVLFADNETDADDLRQEGLLSLFTAIASYDPAKGAKFSTYAEVCVVNRMRTVTARARKRPPRAETPYEDAEAKEPASEEDPESVFLFKEFISELWIGIDSLLSPIERRSLELSMAGASYRGAAEKLGVSEKTVDNAIQRARKKLRAHVNKLNMTV